MIGMASLTLRPSARGGALPRVHRSRRGRNRLAEIGADSPFRPCEQARGRKGKPRQPFGFPGPPDTEARRSGGTQNYTECPMRPFVSLSLAERPPSSLFRVVQCRAKPVSASGDGGRPRRGWGAGRAAGGELVHRADARPRPRPSQTAPRLAGFRVRAKRSAMGG